MRIRITAVPDDEAPERVREQWVGLELSCRGVSTGSIGLFSRRMVHGHYYLVRTNEAIEALGKVNPEAATYWSYLSHQLGETFTFNREACEVIPD